MEAFTACLCAGKEQIGKSTVGVGKVFDTLINFECTRRPRCLEFSRLQLSSSGIYQIGSLENGSLHLPCVGKIEGLRGRKTLADRLRVADTM